MKNWGFLLGLIFFCYSCENKAQEKSNQLPKANKANNQKVNTFSLNEAQDRYATAYFAGGCFWCVEAIYEDVIGVEAAISGYAGGHTANPTYQQTNTGATGHAEAVKIIYDPNFIDFSTLLDIYFKTLNWSQENGQGPDFGSQYRSIAFYNNPQEKKLIENYIKRLEQTTNQPVAVEVEEFDKFWVAEDYHQDYEANNPNNPYIQNVSKKRYEMFKRQFPDLVKPTNE
ncbi:peptide-methionine (S)-S-oxide reductase MsrA [Mesonia sediminis]|uniref:Peptide methionine sulfoxide reductase MsrA n=1 Tax=Mesonia sediminis TaxID=1703946 RepID=A0ABW5SA10_9FLAO